MLTQQFIQKGKGPIMANICLKKSQLSYMDCRENEQMQGITMKSTIISLQYAKESSCLVLNLISL